MRVAYVTPYYNGNCDGRYGRFHDWVHAARDADDPPFDFDVCAFTASNPDATLASRPYAYFGEASDLWGTRLNKPEFLLNARRIRRDLYTGDYDLIHVLPVDGIVLPTVLSLMPSVPIVLGPDIGGWSPIRDGSFADQSGPEAVKNRLRRIFKRIASHVTPYNRVVAFSEYHRDILETVGIQREHTDLLRPGVADCFHPGAKRTPSDPPRLLYVGDFSEHKGYPQFLEALSRIDYQFDAHLIGAGDPKVERIRDLGLVESVTVKGFVSREDLPAHYRAADLFVLPSIDEMGPNTELESLACGTPVVATDRPGINEYAPDDAAVFFSPRNAEALANALSFALDDLESLQAGARQASSLFRAIDTAEVLADTYRDVLADS